MGLLWIVSFLVASAGLIPGGNFPPGQTVQPARAAAPPVLRAEEPEADVIVRLPGPAPAAHPDKPAANPAAGGAPAAENAPAAAAALAALAARPSLLEDPPKPLSRHIYPPSFEADSAVFCQKLIGHWTEDDARFLLGEPLRKRPAFDSGNQPNGAIFAFADPTAHYKEIELDFDQETGTLRTVFAYPVHMTWSDCRRLWGANVTATTAAAGRKFYSYLNRRLDVLVDTGGNVISFGLY